MNPEDQPEFPFEQPAPKRRRGRLIASLIVFVLILGAIGFFWVRHQREVTAQAAGPGGPGGPGGGGPGGGGRRGQMGGGPTAVGTAVARSGRLDVKITALGTIIPRNVVTVHPRVDGLLMSINFREGQTVKAGDVLAQIDPKPFEVALANANGQLARDTALLQNSQADVERYRTLLGQDSIAKQQVDTQESLVRQYQGTIATDKAAVDDAKLQLGYARVTAPISGRVGLRQVDAGNIVHGSDVNGLVVITEVQPISVVFTIPQDQLPSVLKSLNAGEKMRIEAWDREDRGRLDIGSLITTDNQIDTTTSTVKLKGELPNPDGTLFPNQFVNIKLVVSTIDDAIVIPAAAIQRGAPGIYVYVVDEEAKTVSVRVIKLGPADGERVSVLDGIKPGERVVIDGTDRLREGAPVEVVDRSGPPQQPGEQKGRRRREGGNGAPGAPGAAGAPGTDGKSGEGKGGEGKGFRRREGAADTGTPPGTPGSLGPGSPGPGVPAQNSGTGTVVPGGAAPSSAPTSSGTTAPAPAPRGTP